MNTRILVRSFRVHAAALSVLALISAACSTSPAQPTGGGSASVTTPRPAQPADSTQIPNLSQPVTLVIQNALATQTPTTYTFEVATDPGFSSKVQTKDSVAEGSSGQTSVKLDSLTAAKDYYWHARAVAGGTFGAFSGTYRFTIGPAITLGAPAPVAPLNGAKTFGWPTFTINNAARTGPVGAITYRFDVSSSADFATILATGTVPEGANQTRFTPGGQPPTQVTLYWRAAAIDQANSITGPYSVVQNFVTAPPSAASLIAAQQGVTLWPGTQPPGSIGNATLGSGWDIGTLNSFNGVVFQSPTLEELQIFDLMDRGMSPQGAIDWMLGHGYPTTGVYYDASKTIGFPYQYMALINGRWDLVKRVGA